MYNFGPKFYFFDTFGPAVYIWTFLVQKTQRQIFGNNADVISSKDDESEEFYSPKGSINGKDSSIGTGSASRRAFAAIEVENFNSSTSNSSSTYSSSVPGSGSPARSVSVSLSPANNPSLMNSVPKSPDLIEIQTVPPLPPQIPSPPEARASLLQELASPSPPSSSSPERYSRRSEEISPRNSSLLDQNLESPAIINSPVHHNATVSPTPQETLGLELAACESPSPLTFSPRNSNTSDRNVESPGPRITNDIPTSPELRSSELLEFALPFPLSSSPRNSNASDQNLESSVGDNIPVQHTTLTPLEIRGLELAESALPLPLSSSSPERCARRSVESSPRNSNVSDQSAESPVTARLEMMISAVAPPAAFSSGICFRRHSISNNLGFSGGGLTSPSTKLYFLSSTAYPVQKDVVLSFQAFQFKLLDRLSVHAGATKAESYIEVDDEIQDLKSYIEGDLALPFESAVISDQEAKTSKKEKNPKPLSVSSAANTSKKGKNPKQLNSSAALIKSPDHFQVIRYPLRTEAAIKAMLERNTLVFVVDKRADKNNIKDSAKNMFKIPIKKVNTSIMPDGNKKAFIMLAPGCNAADVAKRIKIL
ncbi:ribosomal protein L23AB [Perilla frutescens var. hirtella]|uniref:Ribosomal protein L23AB n=1 Tax=Perilla frutescens var. hirtella TaxID=608512 RepID=A0AAD4J6B1_PERFH|nr:ribosomal protein L23AB [Perilla frutescens var. hirtella]